MSHQQKSPVRRSTRQPAVRREDSVHVYESKPVDKVQRDLAEKRQERAKRVNRGLRRANTVFEYAGHPETRETADNPFGKLVGKRVEVWWSKKRRWFPGRVVEFDAFNGLHVVDYDDHTSCIHNLGKAKYRMEGSATDEDSPVKKSAAAASTVDNGGVPTPKKAKASEGAAPSDDGCATSGSEPDGDDHVIQGTTQPVHGGSHGTQPTGGTVAGMSSGPTVLPESGLAAPGRRVLTRDGEDYDASLTMVNMATNTDKFYRLQVVESADCSEYWSVQHWGRTGTAGQVKVAGGLSLQDAVAAFEVKFKEKSGLSFGDRTSAAVPGKYKATRREYGEQVFAKWQYYVDDFVDGKADGWYPYQDSAANIVEGVHSEWQCNDWLNVRSVQSGYFEYRVDFDTMTQTNLRTHKCRKIRRVVAG